jgi:hypothetical protein
MRIADVLQGSTCTAKAVSHEYALDPLLLLLRLFLLARLLLLLLLLGFVFPSCPLHCLQVCHAPHNTRSRIATVLTFTMSVTISSRHLCRVRQPP